MAELSNRPLLPALRDQALMLDRPAELDLIDRAVAGRLNVLITGAPGSGATTTLHQLHRRLALAQRSHARFVNASAITSADRLLDEVAGALVPTVAVVDDAGAYSRFARYGELPDGVVALVDNASPRLLRETFAGLRDETWQVPVAWVVTCHDRDRHIVLDPPADAFFDVVVELGPLTDVEAASLLRRRTTRDELSTTALQAAVAAGAGNPRALIGAARRIVIEGADPAEVTQAAVRRAGIRQALSRPAAMLLDELAARGPCSASDVALQAATGWTRSRLVQVFGELERVGAVDSDAAGDGRSGRPRKTYRARF